MARKLATIQTIREVNDIPNANAIGVASVLGWKVVIRKDEFKVGDKCIYCEIDSILPEKPEFEFMRQRKYRVRTIRLRGQLSQGICFPLSILPKSENLEVGEDVTELLGIKKFIPQIPACLKGLVKGRFPTFIPKTDETRVQILQDIITRYKGSQCYVTEKLDGSSVTYYLKNGEFGVCSRNLELLETEANMFWKMAREMKIEEKLRTLGRNMAIQGELIGIGIQKNNLKLDYNRVFFFNAFDIDKFKYLDYDEFVDVMVTLGLETVPVIETNYILEDDIDELVEKSKGKSKLNEDVFREGIVIRPIKEEYDFQMSQGIGNGRVTFKAVNPDYLLKFEE